MLLKDLIHQLPYFTLNNEPHNNEQHIFIYLNDACTGLVTESNRTDCYRHRKLPQRKQKSVAACRVWGYRVKL